MWIAITLVLISAVAAGLKLWKPHSKWRFRLRKSRAKPPTAPPPPLITATPLLPSGEEFPYQAREFFFSKAERSFYEVLRSVVGERWVVFPKVHMAEVIGVEPGIEAWHSHFNRVNTKRVDFLLCESKTMKAVLAVELESEDQKREDRRERDAFLEQAFKVADVPLLRLKANFNYSVEEIECQILERLGVIRRDPNEKYYRNCGNG